jgi:hypothetical protein
VCRLTLVKGETLGVSVFLAKKWRADSQGPRRNRVGTEF